MAQLLNRPAPPTAAIVNCSSLTRADWSPLRFCALARRTYGHHSWASLCCSLKCSGRFTCLFSDNRKEEQARKALESALGGKKTEFEKWDKEIKKRAEAGEGGHAGGGGWFRWGRWFGGSDGEHFWQEAQQAGLAVIGIILMYLVIAKGDVMLAVIFNPLLFALRGPRNGFNFVTSQILQKMAPTSHANFENSPREESHNQFSAKERVTKKWGSD